MTTRAREATTSAAEVRRFRVVMVMVRVMVNERSQGARWLVLSGERESPAEVQLNEALGDRSCAKST